jgi:hypothetical protein
MDEENTENPVFRGVGQVEETPRKGGDPSTWPDDTFSDAGVRALW